MTCQHMIIKYGLDSKYTKDCQVRAIRGLSYDTAKQMVNWEGDPPIVIQAGIGTLILGPDKEEFTPAPTLGQKAASFIKALSNRAPATPEEQERRSAICRSCPHWFSDKQTCGVCGCNTAAKTALQMQSCPKNHW